MVLVVDKVGFVFVIVPKQRWYEVIHTENIHNSEPWSLRGTHHNYSLFLVVLPVRMSKNDPSADVVRSFPQILQA